MVMDSLSLFIGLSSSTILQICNIYKVPRNKSSLKIQRLAVQQQRGNLDCGLFAVAYAMEVCAGNNPEHTQFDQCRMRNHLYDCLRLGVITAFPKTQASEHLPRPTRSVKSIKVYCVCRMPEDYDDQMVCCDQCDEWFHLACLNLRSQDVNKTKEWKCNGCEH